MHNCVGTIFDKDILMELAWAVEDAEAVLSRISKTHNVTLGIVEEDA